MRLIVGLIPALTEEVLSKLKTVGVTNFRQFMLKDPEILAKDTNISYRDLQSIRRLINARYAAFPIPGSDMLDEAVRSTVIISTGISSLDSLLGGGLMTGEIVELCGKFGVGKSSLCAHLAFHSALKHGFHVLYVSSGANNPSHSLRPFIDNTTEEVEKLEQALSRIQVVAPSNIWGLFKALRKVWKSHSTGESGADSSSKSEEKIKLLILDSVHSFVYPLILSSLQGFALLTELACRLKQISAEHQVAVVVTNNVTEANYNRGMNQRQSLNSNWKPTSSNSTIYQRQSSNSKWKAGLGRYWAHVPNTRLFIEKIDRAGTSRKRLQDTEASSARGDSTFDVNVTIWKSSRLKMGTSKVTIL